MVNHVFGQLRNRYARCVDFIRQRMPSYIPIAAKLAFVSTLLLATGMITIAVLIGTNQSVLLNEQMHRFGKTLARQVTESVKEPLLAGDTLSLELYTNGINDQQEVLGAAVYSDEGRPVATAGMVPPQQRLRLVGSDSALSLPYLIWTTQGSQGESFRLASYIAPVRYRELTVGFTLLTFDQALLERARKDTITTVSLTVFLMLLTGIFASIHLGKRMSRPITQLKEASDAIASGQYRVQPFERRNDEIGVLMQSLNTMVEGLLRKEQIEGVFSRYVAPQVARQIMRDLEQVEAVELGGRHMQASVLFADIVGFTSISEKLPPEDVSRLLNEYFSQIADIVHFCGGHIDKYMGDCAMIVFGVPEQHDDHAFLALSCAWMLLEHIRRYNQLRAERGRQTVEFRIGLNGGSVLAGNMGSAERMEYTVVGDTVNLASRLSHAGGPGEAIFSEPMYRLPGVGDRVAFEQHDVIAIRGKEAPVATYRVVDINAPFRDEMLRHLDTLLLNLSEKTI